MKLQISKNNSWNENHMPRVTVITPVYNRRKTLQRTIDSVVRQTYKDLEYIIIDDGSQEAIDDIVTTLMNQEKFPVMFIKKENGGVHTARNLGFKNARGELSINLDSDDELTENAIQTFVDTWDSIPEGNREEYREIVGQCVLEDGTREGKPFPTDINLRSWPEAYKICKSTKGEHVGFFCTKIMKENPFPEPKGITFVGEDILWDELATRYKSYFINDMVRIYHTDSGNSLSTNMGNQKRSIQYCLNTRWGQAYFLNHKGVYIFSTQQYLRCLAVYCVMDVILKSKMNELYEKEQLDGFTNNLLAKLFGLPSYVVALLYMKKKM